MNHKTEKPRKGFFRIIGLSLDMIRRIILNLVFWSLLVIAVLAFLPQRLKIRENTLFYLQPQGQIVDAITVPDYPARISPLLNTIVETSSIEMGQAIRYAADDERITGMVLDCSLVEYASLAVLQDLASDLDYFKKAGKRIYAWAPSYNQYAYYLASEADVVYLDDMGAVTLSGFGVYRSYFRKGMDKWNLEMTVFQAGEFKSFVEPYLYDHMSAGVKKDNIRWTGNLWEQVLQKLSASRAVAEDHLRSWINSYPEMAVSSGKSEAEIAIDGGLVDVRGTWETFSADMIRVTGYDSKNRGFRFVYWFDYLKERKRKIFVNQGKTVAVVTAGGEIHSGEGNSWTIGSSSLIRQLETAEQDKSVRAIVLRLDTGGGSAYAAEEVRRTLERIRNRGITLVVSMGGITASGGYWIACESDELWSAPGTITGSIGVFSMVPETDRFLEEQLGITGDGVGTTWMSGQMRPDQPLNQSSRMVLQAGVESTYQQFLRIVSENRNIPVEELKPLAEGRIWTGREARENGLVDNTGTLNEAVESAARLAHLEDYNTWFVPRSHQSLPDLVSFFLGGIRSVFFPSRYRTAFEMSDLRLTPGKIYALSPLSSKKYIFPVDNGELR